MQELGAEPNPIDGGPPLRTKSPSPPGAALFHELNDEWFPAVVWHYAGTWKIVFQGDLQDIPRLTMLDLGRSRYFARSHICQQKRHLLFDRGYRFRQVPNWRRSYQKFAKFLSLLLKRPDMELSTSGNTIQRQRRYHSHTIFAISYSLVKIRLLPPPDPRASPSKRYPKKYKKELRSLLSTSPPCRWQVTTSTHMSE